MILYVSLVPYNLNQQIVVVIVLGFWWRLLRLLCYLLLLLQFFKLVLLLLLGLPNMDTLVHFLIVENYTTAQSHLPHIVSTFISIPPLLLLQLKHICITPLFLLFQNCIITSLKKKKKKLIQSILYQQSYKSPKQVSTIISKLQNPHPYTPFSMSVTNLLFKIKERYNLFKQLGNSCSLTMHMLVPFVAFTCVPSTLPSPQ